MELEALAIGGVQIAIGVAVTVQGLKIFNFVDGKSAPKAAVLSALFFGLGVAAGEIFPVASPFIELAFVTYVGAMLSGLGYEYIAKPVLEKFGIAVSSSDL
jgi:hypothetical protein